MFSVPINKIILTIPIKEAILNLNGDINLTSNKIVYDGSLPLSRMENMINAFKYGLFSNRDNIPPLKIKNSNEEYYKIIDGRHRFVASVIFKNTHINCVYC